METTPSVKKVISKTDEKIKKLTPRETNEFQSKFNIPKNKLQEMVKHPKKNELNKLSSAEDWLRKGFC